MHKLLCCKCYLHRNELGILEILLPIHNKYHQTIEISRNCAPYKLLCHDVLLRRQSTVTFIVVTCMLQDLRFVTNKLIQTISLLSLRQLTNPVNWLEGAQSVKKCHDMVIPWLCVSDQLVSNQR